MKLSLATLLISLVAFTPSSNAVEPGFLDILTNIEKSKQRHLNRLFESSGGRGREQQPRNGGGDRNECNPQGLTGRYSGGPVCIILGGSPFGAPDIQDCFEFPATTDNGATVTQYMDLVADSNGIVAGEWGVLVDNDPNAQGSNSEALVGLMDPNDCTFNLVEIAEQAFFTGRFRNGFITYKHTQPGEYHVIQNGRLNRV